MAGGGTRAHGPGASNLNSAKDCGDVAMDRPQDGGSTSEVTVMATDAAGRTLHCVVEQSLRIQDQDYGILSPVDTPAYLCRWPDDAAAEPELIADPHQYPQVLDELDMVLRSEDLFLVRSAGLLTVAGELEYQPVDVGPDGWELPMDINDLLNRDGDTGDDAEEDDDMEEENALDTCVVLASTCHEGVDFDLYGSLEPCFLVARLGQGTAKLLEPDVLARLQPLIEEALADDGEECP
ncbi:MAG: DUF3727 domain-containing protein [Synechococcus sp. SB0668_bin_15]|nr:DUF3727 domain-containing protein [Synechococcus sp. SB0668_bin_15]MYC50079.1 DUF3727 domain-containing protein [Synechococcus sp. SB0662_bin_14]